jgi:hypothetical protein
MSKNPPGPGVDFRITQLCEEGMIMTTWPWIQPHSHSLLTEWLNAAADKVPQEVHARQPSSQQPLDDVTHGL